MKRNKYFIYALTILMLTVALTSFAQTTQNIYSNGNKFKVLRYVYTDLNENVLDRKDNIKQTTFIIDSKKKLFTVKMGDIYNEYYFYNKVDRIKVDGKTRDVYGIYKSYNTENKNQTLTDVLLLELNPTTNALISYKLYFGDKGFITFYLSPTN